jgi:Transposase IS66 family
MRRFGLRRSLAFPGRKGRVNFDPRLHPCFDAGAIERTRNFLRHAGKAAVKPGDFGCDANTFRRFRGMGKGQHPKDHLARYRGWMHADGNAGFEELYRSGAIREVACMAHVRRKFVDIHRSQGSPIAEEAIGRIAQLYSVEKEARGSPPDRRAELRITHAAPVFDDLEVWLAMQLTTISGKSPSPPPSAMPRPA